MWFPFHRSIVSQPISGLNSNQNSPRVKRNNSPEADPHPTNREPGGRLDHRTSNLAPLLSRSRTGVSGRNSEPLSRRRQRPTIFRLLFPHFERMMADTAKEHHPRAVTLWRLTVETWLRCQGRMSVRRNRKQKVAPTSPESWFPYESNRT